MDKAETKSQQEEMEAARSKKRDRGDEIEAAEQRESGEKPSRAQRPRRKTEVERRGRRRARALGFAPSWRVLRSRNRCRRY